MERELYGYVVDSGGFVWNKKHTAPLAGKINRNGYREVCLCGQGARKYISIHRLIALAFVPNPEGFDIVNHIDGNKLNNDYTNLEWTTVSGNTKHAIETGLFTPPNTSKRTVILDTNTNELHEFKSRKECEEYYGTEFRGIVGSRQRKRFKHLRQVS